MESGNFTHDGVNFHYDIAGKGDKHIVLQHGFSDFAPCWGEMPVDLSKSGYRVSMMDARGHGRSAKPADGYNLDTFTADMMAFVQHLKLDRPVIIGHSMGASMGARAAAKFPDLLRAAVLIDPVFRDIPDEEKELAVKSRKKELLKLKRLSHADIAQAVRSDHPEWSELHIQNNTRGKVFLCIDIVNIFKTLDLEWRKNLENSSCPILLLTADEDKGSLISKKTRDWIKDNFSNVEILHIAGVGHSIHREDYPTTLKGIKNFLAKQF